MCIVWILSFCYLLFYCNVYSFYFTKGTIKKCKSKLEKFRVESEITSITEMESDNHMSYPTLNRPKDYEESHAVQCNDISDEENVSSQVGHQNSFQCF